jgi:hypothetical protein
MSNIVEPQIVETKPSWFSDYIKNNPNLIIGGFPAQNHPDFQKNNGEPYVFLKDFSFIHSTSDGSIGSNMVNYKKDQVVYPFPSSPNVRMMRNPAFTKAINEKVLVPQKMQQQQAQMVIAQPRALMQEMGAYNNRLTDKVFGKQSNFVSGGGNRFLILPTYVILGAVVGRYVAKSMGKSTTLGMVVGGLAPLLAYQLSISYDRKNMPKQEPKQKVAIEPTPTPMPNVKKPSLFDNSKYPMECMMRYAQQPKPAVAMPPEYWKKQEEDWMKTNCK